LLSNTKSTAYVMFVTCDNDLEELKRLMPDAKTRISRIQNAASRSISQNSKAIEESRKGEPKGTTNFQGRNGEVFSGISRCAGGPDLLHVPADKKTDELRRFNSFAFASPATPVRIGTVTKTANILHDQGWTIDYIRKPLQGQGSVRKDDLSRTLCAVKETKDGAVQRFLMAGRSRLGEEGGGTSSYQAWEYSKESKDGSVETLAGNGGSATQMRGRPDYVSNYGGVREQPEWDFHAVACVGGTEIEDESKGSDGGSETFLGSLVPGAWPNGEL
jgi:hypothetical protein